METELKPLSLTTRIERELERLSDAGMLQQQRVLQSASHARSLVGGREVINLASNNYLGFADHPYLKQMSRQFIDQWGAGAGAVRHIAGTFVIHEELERKLAEFKGTATATVFQSGFATNQGVLGALLREGDLVVSDELNHASIIDGVRLTKATKAVFKHADTDDLERILSSTACNGFKLVVTDGVFSMDGDIAPLDRIVDIARKHGATVYVDDAHGSGVLGRHGRGTADHFGLHGAADVIQIGTLSKAWGVVGGYAAGPPGLDTLLRHLARPFVFSTAQPPAVVGAVLAALELIQLDPLIMARLWKNTAYFRSEIHKIGFDTMGSQTPIVPLFFGENHVAARAVDMLLDEGVFAASFSYPVVPHGTARIRNIITAEHSEQDLDLALAAYAKVGRTLGVIL
ncbi:MAG: putative glycine C-acetyltransferase [Polaromonas sp.]|nr:putative glycine C-acetyltransferase [Polaromonas sp.]